MSWLDDETRAKVILKLTELQGKFDVWHGFYDNGLLAREMAEVKHIITCLRLYFITFINHYNFFTFIYPRSLSSRIIFL